MKGKGDAHPLGKVLHGDAESKQQRPRPARTLRKGDAHRKALGNVVKEHRKVQERALFSLAREKAPLGARQDAVGEQNERPAEKEAERRRHKRRECAFVTERGEKKREKAGGDHDTRCRARQDGDKPRGHPLGAEHGECAEGRQQKHEERGEKRLQDGMKGKEELHW